MRILFSDKQNLKKELKNKISNKITIKFSNDSLVMLDKNILVMIREIDKKDKNFIKNLVSSENNLVLFLTKIIKK